MKDLTPAEVIEGKWDQAVPVYSTLLKQCSSVDAKDKHFQITAIILETLHIVVNNLILLEDQETNDAIQLP